MSTLTFVIPRCVGLLPSSFKRVNSRWFASEVHENKIKVGRKLSVNKCYSSEDVKTFANLSGDHNPIHIDADFAATTTFKKPIAHGMLANSLFSGLLAELFGPGSVLLGLECQYKSPVFVNEEFVGEIEIKEVSGRRVTAQLKCLSSDKSKVLIEGTALGLLPKSSTSPSKERS